MNIKSIQFCILAAAWMVQTTPQPASAQGTVYFSHLGSATDTTGPIIASDSSWAVAFETGAAANGYSVDTIQIRIAGVTGNPVGFQLLLCDDNAGKPKSSLEPLIGSTPTSAGVYSFSAAGIRLAPSTVYWVLATSSDLNSSGNTLSWALNSDPCVGTDGWNLTTSSMTGAGGVSNPDWSQVYWSNVSPGGLTLAVSASPVPEPQTYALAGGGLLAYLARRKMVLR